jgi:hypothetical protein
VSEYTQDDARNETGASRSEIREAWHEAREDASKSGEVPERDWSKVSDSKEGKAIFSFLKGTVDPRN